MKIKIASLIFSIIAFTCVGFNLPKQLSDTSTLRKPIEKIKICNGVTAFHAEYDNLITNEVGKFELSFIVVEWNKNHNLGLKIWMQDDLVRHKPSEALAESKWGVACVNGFYHATEDPSIPYFPTRIDGKDWESKAHYVDGVVAFNPYSPPTIGSKVTYTNFINFAGGDGHPRNNPKNDFNKDRPDYSDKEKLEKRIKTNVARTFVGQNTEKNITVFCVADGYVPDATGMTFEEIGWVMTAFGIPSSRICMLDGGGSSTMAIKKNGEVRIINRPRNDHVNVTERRVLTSLQIINRTE